MSIEPISSIDPTEYTQRVVFGGDENSGTLSTSDDYNDHIRNDSSPAPQSYEYDMVVVMLSLQFFPYTYC